jgi:hypothetical protein
MSSLAAASPSARLEVDTGDQTVPVPDSRRTSNRQRLKEMLTILGCSCVEECGLHDLHGTGHASR